MTLCIGIRIRPPLPREVGVGCQDKSIVRCIAVHPHYGLLLKTSSGCSLLFFILAFLVFD
jgi:hypothetical protein